MSVPRSSFHFLLEFDFLSLRKLVFFSQRELSFFNDTLTDDGFGGKRTTAIPCFCTTSSGFHIQNFPRSSRNQRYPRNVLQLFPKQKTTSPISRFENVRLGIFESYGGISYDCRNVIGQNEVPAKKCIVIELIMVDRVEFVVFRDCSPNFCGYEANRPLV